MADMSKQGVEGPCCECCGTQLPVMKRCVQCQEVYYCSRRCQADDWLQHKIACLNTLHTQTQRPLSKTFTHDEKAIFTESENTNATQPLDIESTTINDKRAPRFDFKAAASAVHSSAAVASVKEEGPWFLHNNKLCYDLPLFDSNEPFSEITVKYDKGKVRVNIQDVWDGSDIYKVIASQLHIPLEKVKIIHKGKLLTQDTIREAARAKSVFQVFGEKCVDESGVNKRSIEIMMSQLQIDRNSAVRALQRQPDLLDAMLETANNS